MAKLPRNRTRHLASRVARAALAALGLTLAVPTAASARAVDLIGTWHLLIHYRDDNSTHPDVERWDDKIWIFEKSGSRIRWTEYPIVVFVDESGRFERRDTGQYARELHFWTPNPGQFAEIMAGLSYNSRGSKSKSLRGSDAKGWRSREGSNAMSASVISYIESWSIEGMPELPIFERTDIMGSARAETVEGGTRYETVEVSPDGTLLKGRFERDGTRHGSFRMLRAGAVAALKGRSQEERQKEALGIQSQGAFGANSEDSAGSADSADEQGEEDDGAGER